MNRLRQASIRFRFLGVLVFAVAIVVVLGTLSTWWFSKYRAYSDDLHDRVLLSTRYLGDLNNYTSDYRAAEGGVLLAQGRDAAAGQARALAVLSGEISAAAAHYHALPLSGEEQAGFAQFSRQWTAYRALVDQVQAALGAGRRAGAVALYLGASQGAYNAASDTLGHLTELNIRHAEHAAHHADSAFYNTRRLTIVTMLFASTLVAVGLAYMRWSIADPLIALAGLMMRLARNQTDIEIPFQQRDDEIGAMARAVDVFRLNAIELAMGQEALARHASMLSGKLVEEQRLTHLQRNFLALASHEFRTPLAIIDGQAQRLASTRHQWAPEALAERADKIRHAVLRMTNVINHLIAHARLADSGADVLFDPAPLDLLALLRDVCRLHRDLVPNAVIVEDFPDTPLDMVGDHKLLTHVFSNLVANAIKYSGNRIWLRIAANRDDDHICVIVEDHGLGIHPSDHARIFERYYRGINATGTVGSGLGLYLASTVVDLHGGSITVADAVPHGARFLVRLPVGGP